MLLTARHHRQERSSRRRGQEEFPPLAQGTLRALAAWISPYLPDRQRPKAESRHARHLLRQPRPRSGYCRLFVPPTSQKLPQHPKYKNASVTFFHLLKQMEQLHPYSSRQTKMTLSSFKSSSMTLCKTRRKGSSTAFLFCIVDLINAFRILCPSRSPCQKAGANPMLKTRIKWDGCHETVTVAAENAALPTVLTFQHR